MRAFTTLVRAARALCAALFVDEPFETSAQDKPDATRDAALLLATRAHPSALPFMAQLPTQPEQRDK